MTDPTTASDWMFALAHPVHGAAIREAAGCKVGLALDGLSFKGCPYTRGSLRQWQTAAICHGVQAVIAKHIGDAGLEHSADGGWFVTHDSVPMSDAWPTPHAAWLDAAREWLEVTQ